MGTIAAIGTPYGKGGVAMIRISGHDAFSVAEKIFEPASPSRFEKKLHGTVYYGSFTDEELLSSDLNPEDMLIMRDDRREFRQKISGVLSDFEFKVTTMYIDGMTCAEICTATGKTAKSVDNALQRSKKKLQVVFKK